MASNRFPSAAPAAKRTKTDDPQQSKPTAKKPLLARAAPLRHKVADTFEIMFLNGSMQQHMPPELMEIIFDYASPTALQILAADLNAPLCGANGNPTPQCLDAFQEAFNAYAIPVRTAQTGTTMKMLSVDAYYRLIGVDPTQATAAQAADMAKCFASLGLPHWEGRKYMAFEGFMAGQMMNGDTMRRISLQKYARRLYPH